MKKKLIASILALALVATAFAVVTAQNSSSEATPPGTGGWLGGPCEMSQLTDEERDAIHQQLQEYEQELLAQHGITLTDEQMDALQQALQAQRQEMQGQMRESHQNQFGPYNCTLTDEEREAIREQMESQRAEMQQKRQELLAQYGINLTDEERQEIQEQLQEYRQELLAEYGISCPDHGQKGGMDRRMQGFQRGPGFGACPPDIPPEPTS
jgi:Spy/CpxP family protein refolding chaperone